MMLSAKENQQLEEKANTIREDVIKMLLEAGSGHSAGPLGMADIFSALYFKLLNIKSEDPFWKERDRFVLSCGHICPVLYATLAERGFFPKEELKTLRKLDTRLQGHPHREALPGLETTSGPLGSGLSQASGMALALKMNKTNQRVVVVMSDGEQDEGNTWEAVMFASKYKLDNLTAIMDRNYIQIDGMTEDVMPLDSMKAKYQAFNWNVIEINGHNFEEIASGYEQAIETKDMPTLIIAHTIPGKGVDFMEGKYEWHGKPPNKDEAKVALKELRTLQGKIRSEHE